MKMTEQSAPESAATDRIIGQNSGRDAKGRFGPGPKNRGKPKGARSRATRTAEILLAKDAKRLMQHAIATALGARGGATLRCLLGLIASPLKDRPIQFDIGPITTPAQSLKALDRISEGVAEGAITEPEVAALTALVAKYVDTVKLVDVDQRLQALEQKEKQSS
jgi:hypothetical protein